MWKEAVSRMVSAGAQERHGEPQTRESIS